jgi:hypothetical protein
MRNGVGELGYGVHMRRYVLGFLFLCSVPIGSARADSASIATLEVIRGTGSVEVVKDGRAGPAEAGMKLFQGDEIRTGEKVAVRISYADGSKQILAAKTRLKVFLTNTGIPSPGFLEGAVENEVQPREKPAARPKFVIRTKALVLGVRGTQFVVHTGPKGLEVHTLKGVVEAGRNESELGTDRAIPIRQAFEIKLDGEKIPAAATPFDPNEFLGMLAQKYPEVAQILSDSAK